MTNRSVAATVVAAMILVTASACAAASQSENTVGRVPRPEVSSPSQPTCTTTPRPLKPHAKSIRIYLPKVDANVVACSYGFSTTNSLQLLARRDLLRPQVAALRKQISALDTSARNLHCGPDNGSVVQLLFRVDGSAGVTAVDVDLQGCRYVSLAADTYGQSTDGLLKLVTDR